MILTKMSTLALVSHCLFLFLSYAYKKTLLLVDLIRKLKVPLVYLLWVLVDCQQAWEMEVWKDGSDCRLSQAANILFTREI